ncbi:MAG TPA: hydrogenase nickel incorporation protein HypA, partial [Thermoprotei archaeon]|nr:hydrogenase nickel incorporation protein HypA [Thermoprotei archaeon]
IVLGELQSIDEEILKYALENLKRGTEVENVEFELVKEEVEFKCRRCSNTWKLSDLREELSDDIRESIHFIPEVVHSFIRCPRCGSRDFEVVRGRGLYIESIVVREK